MMVPCDWCIAYPRGGRYDKQRACCRIRWLANAPRHLRLAAYARIADDEGKPAAQAVVDQVRQWLGRPMQS